VVLPDPALPPNAPTLACPQVINGAIEASDDTQTGRYSRDGASSVCGVAKTYPDTAADPTGGHLYDVYRFANPSAAPACFTFTLTYGGAPPVVVDAGLDGGADAAVESPDAAADGGGVVVVPTELQKFLAAFNTFYPTDLSLEYLGDVGGTLTPPQTMGITVPAGETIDVVVYAVANAPAGVDSYTLSCSTP
jgi:hypothetical protein